MFELVFSVRSIHCPEMTSDLGIIRSNNFLRFTFPKRLSSGDKCMFCHAHKHVVCRSSEMILEKFEFFDSFYINLNLSCPPRISSFYHTKISQPQEDRAPLYRLFFPSCSIRSAFVSLLIFDDPMIQFNFLFSRSTILIIIFFCRNFFFGRFRSSNSFYIWTIKFYNIEYIHWSPTAYVIYQVGKTCKESYISYAILTGVLIA